MRCSQVRHVCHLLTSALYFIGVHAMCYPIIFLFFYFECIYILCDLNADNSSLPSDVNVSLARTYKVVFFVT